MLFTSRSLYISGSSHIIFILAPNIFRCSHKGLFNFIVLLAPFYCVIKNTILAHILKNVFLGFCFFPINWRLTGQMTGHITFDILLKDYQIIVKILNFYFVLSCTHPPLPFSIYPFKVLIACYKYVTRFTNAPLRKQ